MPRLLRFIMTKAAASSPMRGGANARVGSPAPGGFHLDHVRAHVGEHAPAHRSRHDVRELDDPDAGERLGHLPYSPEKRGVRFSRKAAVPSR